MPMILKLIAIVLLLIAFVVNYYLLIAVKEYKKICKEIERTEIKTGDEHEKRTSDDSDNP